MVNGSVMTGDALDILSRVVEDEMGSPYHEECLKAMTVAVYSVIKNYNARGQYPVFYPENTASAKVTNAVKSVIGQAAYYKGSYANTTFFAVSCGVTTTAKSVWGYGYDYLVSVDSSIDTTYAKYEVQTTRTAAQVASAVQSKLGVDLTATADKAQWIEVLTRTDGLYVGSVRVGDRTVTGRYFRENIMGLRSAAFDVEYSASADSFTFTTYGYGHGVGMSAIGAHLYASERGWDYIQILEHYYPGVTIK